MEGEFERPLFLGKMFPNNNHAESMFFGPPFWCLGTFEVLGILKTNPNPLGHHCSNGNHDHRQGFLCTTQPSNYLEGLFA